MDHESFRHWARRAADWGADYRAGLRDRPVRPPVRPGDAATRALIEAINAEGRVYLTRTTHGGRFLIRFRVGQFDCTEADVREASDTIAAHAARIDARIDARERARP